MKSVCFTSTICNLIEASTLCTMSILDNIAGSSISEIFVFVQIYRIRYLLRYYVVNVRVSLLGEVFLEQGSYFSLFIFAELSISYFP